MKKEKVNFKRIFHYFWQALMQYKFRTILLLILIPVNIFISNVIWPRGTSDIIGMLSGGDFEIANYTGVLLFTILPTVFNNLVLVRILDWLDWSLDAKCGEYLSQLAFSAVINQSMTFHSNHFSGSLTSQANKLASAFIDIKSNFVWDIFPLLLMVIYSIGAAFAVCPPFAGILLVFTILYAAAAIITYYKTTHIDAKLAEAENKQTGQLADSITNVVSVKSYARERFEKARFARATKRTREATFDVAKVSFFRNTILNLLGLLIWSFCFLFLILCLVIFGVLTIY